MKLPSVQYLSQQALYGFKNFPTTILSAIIGTGFLLYLTEVDGELQNEFPIYNAILIFAIGLPLYLSASILTRHYQLDRKKSIAVQLIATGVLVFIYTSLPGQESTFNRSVPYFRYVIYNVLAHLLVAFIPYLKRSQLNGFWNYNKMLFLRILTSLLYSGFLSLGIILAMLSVNLLFNAEIGEIRFFQVYLLVQGVFNTWFFVSGIPESLGHLDEVNSYPKGLKVFTQYILVPLLVVYLVILYVYAGKILFGWNWPEGIVSYLIICVAVGGIFNMLLIYPFGAYIEGNQWIKKFSRVYYFLLFPLVILLFIAIGMRISDYGYTVNRYIIVILGVWLTFISGYFILGKQNIKIIPMSMAGILFLMSFGPWNIFSVAERSQVRRLESYLRAAGMLIDGKIQGEVIWDSDTTDGFNGKGFGTNEHMLSDSVHNEVISILDYLDDHHGFESLATWFEQDLDSVILARTRDNTNYIWQNESIVYTRSMGLDPSFINSNVKYLYFRRDQWEALSVQGFDYQIGFSRSGRYNQQSRDTHRLREGLEAEVQYDHQYDSPLLVIIEQDTAYIPVSRMLEKLRISHAGNEGKNWPQKDVSLSFESDAYRFKVVLDYISLTESRDSVEVDQFEAVILLSEK